MSDDRPQHSGGFSGSLSTVRAGIILVAFVVGVVILVAVGTRPTVTSPASSAQTTTTTTTPTTTTSQSGGSTTSTGAAAGAASTTTTTRAGHHHGATTTTTTLAPGTVSVLVANATNTSGLAGHYITVLGSKGWHTMSPANAATTESTSTVYYAAGMQQPATAIASTIGVKPTQVQPLTTATPVASVAGADVVVVVGQDLASSAAGS